MIECAYCNDEIDVEREGLYKCQDNFLIAKYFDSEKDNVFCSPECFGDFCSLELSFDIEEDENEEG